MGQVSWIFAAGALTLASCGAEQAPSGSAAGSVPQGAKGTEASTGDLFTDAPQISVVNGEQAATIDISLPANIADLPAPLAEEIHERANRGTEDFVSAAEADKAEAAREGFEFRPHSLDVNWVEVGPETGRLAGYLGTYSTYTGGAHPNVGFDMLNWDREAETALVFEDFFKDVDAARNLMTDALKVELLKVKRERLESTGLSDDELMKSWVNPAFEGNDAVFEGFTIARSSEEGKAGGFVYHFAPYEVGAYAEGVYEVAVSHEAFASALKPAYNEAFAGAPFKP